MVRKLTCRRCGRSFESERALKQHLKSKHFSYYLARHAMPPTAVIILISIAVVLAAQSYLAGLRTPPTTTQEDLLKNFLTPQDKLAMHIHPRIQIFVDGQEVKVPAGIGISRGKEKYIHTHSDDGIIHVESPIQHDFTLDDFFKVWGKRFDEACFDIYCGNITVNGQPAADPQTYVLRDGEEIVIEVSTA